MHTNNTNTDTNFNSFENKLQDLYATFSEKFSELKHKALALWLKALVEGLESQNFSLDEILFALSEITHDRSFDKATELLFDASSAVLEKMREDNGRD